MAKAIPKYHFIITEFNDLLLCATSTRNSSQVKFAAHNIKVSHLLGVCNCRHIMFKVEISRSYVYELSAHVLNFTRQSALISTASKPKGKYSSHEASTLSVLHSIKNALTVLQNLFPHTVSGPYVTKER
jgi:hypothetical protein